MKLSDLFDELLATLTAAELEELRGEIEGMRIDNAIPVAKLEEDVFTPGEQSMPSERIPAQSFRLPPETVAKINEIAVLRYMDKTAVVRWAIDNIYDVAVKPTKKKLPKNPE